MRFIAQLAISAVHQNKNENNQQSARYKTLEIPKIPGIN